MSLVRDQVKVLSLAEGFFSSRILLALLKLRVFTLIGSGERSVAELATEIGARPETLQRLLRGGLVIGLLESDDGAHFRLTDACRRVLLADTSPEYLGNWILNLEYFQEALAQLDEAVLTSGPTVEFQHDAATEREHTREFTLAMHNYASLRGRELARYLDTSGCETLLDLGAGPGTYAFHLGEANPELQIFLLDLPAVLEIARDVEPLFRLRTPPVYLGMDIRDESIPGSYDLVLVSNTLHMLGEAHSRTLLSDLYQHVNPGGSLVVQAQYLDDDGLGPRWPALLDLIQLCITPEGRNHTVAETRAWLEDAGFERVEFCEMTMLNTNSYLRAYKPA